MAPSVHAPQACADDDEPEPEEMIWPTLAEAVTSTAQLMGLPGVQQGATDPDLEALMVLLSREAVTGLVVAYDCIVDGAPCGLWEIYGSGRNGQLYADGRTFQEALHHVMG